MSDAGTMISASETEYCQAQLGSPPARAHVSEEDDLEGIADVLVGVDDLGHGAALCQIRNSIAETDLIRRMICLAIA